MRRWWSRLLGKIPEALTDSLIRDRPRREYEGIELVMVDPERASEAGALFDRMESALQLISRSCDTVYARMKRDVARILLWNCNTGIPYHHLQHAVIVPPEVATEPDLNCLAAWLLHVTGSSEEQATGERVTRFLQTLSPSEGGRISSWLGATLNRARIARESPESRDNESREACEL